MKNSRPRIKYSQTPHSISRRIETIPNKTAAALLSLINRKTVGFGVGYVDLPYRQISDELGVGARAIQNAAKLLEQWGDIIRERVACRIYRWRVVLESDEIIEDPRKTYTTKDPSEEQVRIQRSGPCGSNDPDHADPKIRTMPPQTEHDTPCETDFQTSLIEQNPTPLKNSFKERDLKKQQQKEATAPSSDPVLQEQPACDDEPLHKICLKGLREHGVSQRMARKLCRENSHELILSVLETAPKRTGIQNLAAYIVSEIQDGGYEQTLVQKNGHQFPGDRSNYAHLTDKKLNAIRHNTVKATTTTIDAPISYRSVEETKTELQALEKQKLKKEHEYQQKSRQLADRFKALSQDLQLRLKLVASVHLSKLVPATDKREQMLKDKTFRRMANRTVLEGFFESIDQGLDDLQALHRLESLAAA